MVSKNKKVLIFVFGFIMLALAGVYVYFNFFSSGGAGVDYVLNEDESSAPKPVAVKPAASGSADTSGGVSEELVPFERFEQPSTAGLPADVQNVMNNINEVNRINRINTQIEKIQTEDKEKQN